MGLGEAPPPALWQLRTSTPGSTAAHRFREALSDFQRTLAQLRGNAAIDYTQLGLRFKLQAWEVGVRGAGRGWALGVLSVDRRPRWSFQAARPEDPILWVPLSCHCHSWGRVDSGAPSGQRGPQIPPGGAGEGQRSARGDRLGRGWAEAGLAVGPWHPCPGVLAWRRSWPPGAGWAVMEGLRRSAHALPETCCLGAPGNHPCPSKPAAGDVLPGWPWPRALCARRAVGVGRP